MPEPEPHPLLPAWFTQRMMSDHWSFGLLTTANVIIAIERITDISKAADGSVWLDAELLTTAPFGENTVSGFPIFVAPTSRTTCSINAAHVVAAIELADT